MTSTQSPSGSVATLPANAAATGLALPPKAMSEAGMNAGALLGGIAGLFAGWAYLFSLTGDVASQWSTPFGGGLYGAMTGAILGLFAGWKLAATRSEHLAKWICPVAIALPSAVHLGVSGELWRSLRGVGLLFAIAGLGMLFGLIFEWRIRAQARQIQRVLARRVAGGMTGPSLTQAMSPSAKTFPAPMNGWIPPTGAPPSVPQMQPPLVANPEVAISPFQAALPAPTRSLPTASAEWAPHPGGQGKVGGTGALLLERPLCEAESANREARVEDDPWGSIATGGDVEALGDVASVPNLRPYLVPPARRRASAAANG